ncbi:MAG: hypothetical protein RLZ12_561 [Bacillota bacterium]
MAKLSYIAAIQQALAEELERDEDVLILGEDVGQLGGVFRVTEGLQAKFGAERVMDTPLAEGAIIGVALGAAAYGLKPIAEIQFADFIFPAINQLISEVARLRYRSFGAWSCPMVVRVPYGGGVHGGLYHSQCIEQFFCGVPGLKVVAPATPQDAYGLLKSAVRAKDPVLFLEHKKCYRLIVDEVVTQCEQLVPIGKAEVKRVGEDITIISYGLAMHEVVKAAELVAEEDISVHLLDLRTLAPLDRQAILDAVAKTGKVLIVHEDNVTGGLGGEIVAIIAEEGFMFLDAPPKRLGGPNLPAMPYSKPLEEGFMLRKEVIAEEIRRLVRA